MYDLTKNIGKSPLNDVFEDDVGPNGGVGEFASRFPNVRRQDPGPFGNAMQGQSILPQYGQKPPMGPPPGRPPMGPPPMGGAPNMGMVAAMRPGMGKMSV